MKRLLYGIAILAAATMGVATHRVVNAGGDDERGSYKDLYYVGYCDGLHYKISGSNVKGNETCCYSGTGKGKTFNNSNGTGFYYIDKHQPETGGSFEWDIYQSGPYAGEFYVFSYPDGTFLNSGNWANGVCTGRSAEGAPGSAE